MTKQGNQKKKILSKKQQTGDFLNRYDFAYGGRDTVNEVGETTLGVIENASAEINNIAQQCIHSQTSPIVFKR